MRPEGPTHWRCLPFDALSARTLYRVLQLRSQVFVVEQNCVFQDMDGADAQCMHVLAESHRPEGVELMAYARLAPAGLKYTEASIGRVVTNPVMRGSGIGHALIRQSVHMLHGLWGVQPIRIGAQAHLQSFYRQHGFEAVGELYDEDGIAHTEMLRL
ncbi:GNAT family N-acetyltransferase [Hydrogenophaga sp.]|uniref:GNAT family N-acetyltransferase n=1 Tax=Hydrogenophaga sp. TaxID=1904254 RepID=UPI00272FE6E6|nr:GNAT family N-acetyltransferase [Hydrogenophaga sp.]MDP1687612.1 GNAT family N-acetyltransferase [Hydrogenophaga sp.]